MGYDNAQADRHDDIQRQTPLLRQEYKHTYNQDDAKTDTWTDATTHTDKKMNR